MKFLNRILGYRCKVLRYLKPFDEEIRKYLEEGEVYKSYLLAVRIGNKESFDEFIEFLKAIKGPKMLKFEEITFDESFTHDFNKNLIKLCQQLTIMNIK